MPRIAGIDRLFSREYHVCMIRVNYYLTEQQIERLKAESARTGLSLSELIRRAIDAWIAKAEKSRKGNP